MPRRTRRREAAGPGEVPAPTCFLCGRALGRRTEFHHPVPKSRGGRHTEPVHPICHRTIHAALDNKRLEREFATPEALREHPEIARFLAWVANKDPDFHAPTRRKRPGGA